MEVGDIDQLHLADVVVAAQGIDQHAGGVHCRNAGDGQLGSLAAELDRVTVRVAAMGAGGDDVIHQATFQQVDHIRACAAHLAYDAARDHLAVQVAGRLGGAVDLVAVVMQFPGQFGGFGLVAVLDGNNAAGAGAGHLELIPGGDQALHHGLVEGGRNAQYFTGGLHLGAEHGIDAVQLQEAVDRHLDGVVRAFAAPPQAGAVAHILELFAQGAAHGQVDHRHAGDFGDVGHGAGRTGVDLDNVDAVVLHSVLHIDQADDFQLAGKAAGVIDQRVNDFLAEGVRRVDADRVAGVYAGAFDLLHDAGHKVIGAVADGVDLALGAKDVLVHQHGMAHVHMLGDNAHVLGHIGRVVSHDHVLAAQYVGRAHQHGIADFLRGLQGFFQRKDGAALGAGDAAALEQLVKALAVLGFVDGICRGAQDGQADLVHMLGQLDGGLAAELHKAAVRLLGLNDLVDAFGVQRVEVQAVAGVKVGGNGLGVVVDQHCLAAVVFQCPDGVDRAIVEFDALADADGAGAENENLLLFGVAALGNKLLSFVVLIEGGVEIRRLGGKFSGTGIDHLKGRNGVRGQRIHTGQAFDGLIQEAELLGVQILFGRQFAIFQAHLDISQVLHLIEEPPVDLGDVVDGLMRHAALEGFVDAERALGVLHMQVLDDLLGGELFEVGQGQGIKAQLGGGDRLHHGVLKVIADGHDFTGGHHLGAEGFVGVDELVKRPLGVFDDNIVQRRLEAGAGLAGNIVGDLVQRVSQGDLGGDLSDGIAGGLGGQRRGARHTGVDLDDGVLEAVRLQGKLAVAAALDAKLGDDIQRSVTQHLVFFIGKGLAGGHNDGVAGMDADGVEVLHVADGDHVALGVTHDLVLDLFPAGDALFHQDLVNGGKTQAVGGDLVQFFAVLADAAAGAAHGKGRAHDDGIADDLGKIQRVVKVLYDLGRDDGLMQLFHRVLEQLTVLGAVDGIGPAGQQAHAAAVQKAVAGQFHAEVQAHLAAQVGQDGIGLFLLDDALDDLSGQGFDIDMIGNVGVGHNGSGVRVDQHGLDALGFQGTAGLGAGVVKLGCLADDDGAGTDDQHLFNTRVLRHRRSLLSLPACG